MPTSFDVSAASGGYTVTIGSGLLDGLLNRHSTALVMVDRRLLGSMPSGWESVIPIEATETNKSLEHLSAVITRMRQLKAHRRTHMLAIGGGIVQDIATFCASIYMRGISWDYLPTTLLGMVDSCIGGKSSINVSGYKNLVGNFYPPQEVIVDVAFAGSLSPEQRIAGLCEAAKICYARSEQEFDLYLKARPGSNMDEAATADIVLRSLQAKRWFIEVDEFDLNERLLLNFGHTFGHALEAASGFGIAHGIAVGVGMMVAANYAQSQHLLDEKGRNRCGHLIAHVQELLATVPESYQTLRSIDLDLVLAKFESDKKHTGDHYRVIVPTQSGDLEIKQLPKSGESLSEIGDVYQDTLSTIFRIRE